MKSCEFTAILCTLAMLAPSPAVETIRLRIELVPGSELRIRPLDKAPEIVRHLHDSKREDQRPLEFRFDPDMALIVESVCLLERAFAGCPARGDWNYSEAVQIADSHSIERFEANSVEVLSALHAISTAMPVTQHEFVSADHQVQRAVFGKGPDEVAAIINTSATAFRLKSRTGADVLLPPYGFVVEGPDFVAFHASRWAGVDYDVPSLFILRSLDGQPLAISRSIRVFHAFGDARLNFAGAIRIIEREATITPNLTTLESP